MRGSPTTRSPASFGRRPRNWSRASSVSSATSTWLKTWCSTALVEALEHWPGEGIPSKPGAWLLASTRRKAIDRWRRDARFHQKLALLERPADGRQEAAVDDQLAFLFTCCHPALNREAQIALTLRAVAG